MTLSEAPHLDRRRRSALRDELTARARAWLPEWRPRAEGADGEQTDFAAALFEIAARIGAEVTQRFDKVPEKSFRGFLHWLGLRGEAGRAASIPVVFSSGENADPIDAPAGVQIQATAGDAPVTFETAQPIRILRAKLATVVAADPAHDRFTLVPKLLSPLQPPAALPEEWTLRSLAPDGATRLQLDPEVGLEPGMVLKDSKQREYQVTGVDAGIVSIAPPLNTPTNDALADKQALPAGEKFTLVTVFDPFGETIRSRQQHALYIGAKDALNLESAATIELTPVGAGFEAADWHYWGKQGNSESDWQELKRDKTATGGLLLEKPAGAIEEAEPDGLPKSRWIRATYAPLANAEPSEASALQLKINSKDCGTATPPAPAGGVKIEAFANTRPLVLDAPFNPLGLEPRQFDAFYLGCKEAFSKPRATVVLGFKFDDGFKTAATAIAWDGMGTLALAVGLDHKLKRLWRPSAANAAVQRDSIQAQTREEEFIPLGGNYPPSVAMLNGEVHAIVGDGRRIWHWVSNTPNGAGTWTSLGAPVKSTVPEPEFEPLLMRKGNGLILYLRANEKLFAWDFSKGDLAGWESAQRDGDTVKLARLASVVRENAVLGGSDESDGLFVIDQADRLLRRRTTGTWQTLSALGKVDPEVRPLIMKIGSGHAYVAARKPTAQGRQLVGFDPDKLIGDNANLVEHTIDLVGGSIAVSTEAGRAGVGVILAARESGAVRAAVWYPFNGDVYRSLLGVGGIGEQSTGPVNLGTDVVFPAVTGDLGILSLRRESIAPLADAALSDAAVFTDGTDWSNEGPLLLQLTAGGLVDPFLDVQTILPLPNNGWALELKSARAPNPNPQAVEIYQALDATPRDGTRKSGHKIALEATDKETQPNDLLHVTDGSNARIYEVSAVTGSLPNRVAEIDSDAPALPAGPGLSYRRVKHKQPMTVQMLPTLSTEGVAAVTVNALANGRVSVSGLSPDPQTIKVVVPAKNRVLLDAVWNGTVPPSAKVKGLAYSSVPNWQLLSVEPPRNPELSWEYWNGSGWWRIQGVLDRTADFVSSGNVTFCVPADMQATDVAGRTNFWIRARLVSGDFGKETVKVTDKGNGVQEIERNTDNQRPPYVTDFQLAYQLCCPIAPDKVIALDGGTLRDQTDANRTPGASVRYFMPLAWELARVSADSFAATGKSDDKAKPPAADCIDCATGAAWSPGDEKASGESKVVSAGPAIYLGFDGELQGNAISLLFLVSETEGLVDEPLRVDALANGAFQRIEGVRDNTRGLNENGTVTFNLARSPERMRLFGDERYWLRILPGLAAADAWRPQIQAIYLNAAWASATETQAFERLGSSDGAPDRKIALARPPVRKDSLKLRIRESLSDEDIDQLRRNGTDVEAELHFWKGPWVLWKEVSNVADWGKHDRVYSLDDETGTITFGDGLRGMIPPIGTDNIVAESYQKVGDVSANAVRAWSQLSLVTPLPGVEGVIAPQGAAGGASAQDAAATIRFAPANLNMRERALTLRDFETLALQFSPLIGQAKALPRGSGLRLVIAGRGPDPLPDRALRRTLRDYLAGLAAPAAGSATALQVVAPDPVPLRVELKLTVAAIEMSPKVAQDSVARLVTLFDPGRGGLDGAGWRLGTAPSKPEIAAALVEIDGLEGVDDVVFKTIDKDDALIPLPAVLKPAQLLQLTGDDIRISFNIGNDTVPA
ncbi:hypothetical protein [Dongia sp.]|uniref:hypothetical protein n=1 Tax=Dongia sp. TaxID=1977262 RepID=UPI0037522AED